MTLGDIPKMLTIWVKDAPRTLVFDMFCVISIFISLQIRFLASSRKLWLKNFLADTLNLIALYWVLDRLEKILKKGHKRSRKITTGHKLIPTRCQLALNYKLSIACQTLLGSPGFLGCFGPQR